MKAVKSWWQEGREVEPKYEETQEQPVYVPEEHPWLEIADSSIDEPILYSLDELRFTWKNAFLRTRKLTASFSYEESFFLCINGKDSDVQHNPKNGHSIHDLIKNCFNVIVRY